MATIRVLFPYVYLTARKGNPVVIPHTYTAYTLIVTWADRRVLWCKPIKLKPLAADIRVGLTYKARGRGTSAYSQAPGFQVPKRSASLSQLLDLWKTWWVCVGVGSITEETRVLPDVTSYFWFACFKVRCLPDVIWWKCCFLGVFYFPPLLFFLRNWVVASTRQFWLPAIFVGLRSSTTSSGDPIITWPCGTCTVVPYHLCSASRCVVMAYRPTAGWHQCLAASCAMMTWSSHHFQLWCGQGVLWWTDLIWWSWPERLHPLWVTLMVALVSYPSFGIVFLIVSPNSHSLHIRIRFSIL